MSSITPEEIKELRSKRKMTQVQLAKFIGVTVDSVRKWEAGQRVPTPPIQKIMGWMKEGKV